MPDTIDHLIREIAAKHGVAVGRDDPILILQTINAQLLEEGQRAQRALLQTHKEELEVIAQRWGVDAKDKAERILTAGLSAAKDAMASVVEAGTAAALSSLQREMGQSAGQLTAVLEQSRQLARLNLIAAACTLLAAAIALFASSYP